MNRLSKKVNWQILERNLIENGKLIAANGYLISLYRVTGINRQTDLLANDKLTSNKLASGIKTDNSKRWTDY